MSHPVLCLLLFLLLEPKVLLNFIHVYVESFSNTHAGSELEYYFDLFLSDSSGSGSGGSGLEENPVMCFSSIDCRASSGEAPIMVSSRKECCLKSPFQPRSFSTTNDTAEVLGDHCAQCIGML